MSNGENSQLGLHRWLPYIEAAIVVLFIGLVFFYTRKGEPKSTPLPVSQAETLIKGADDNFAKQDLSRAAIGYWQAIESLEAAKQQSPNADVDSLLLQAYLRVAAIYSHSSWVEDARKRLERAAEIQPDHIEVYLLRGKLLRDDGEKEEAIKEFEKVLEKDPNHAEAHYLLGVLNHGLKRYDEAIAAYKKAIENDPNLVTPPFESTPIGLQARLQLSRTYRRMLQDFRFIDREMTAEETAELGQLEARSIALLEEVVAKEPNHLEAKDELIGMLYARASALGREGETRSYDKALEVYEQIARLDPEDVDAWSQIGQINLYFLQDAEAALKAYRKAYELKPDPGLLAEIKNLEEQLTVE